MNRRKFLTTGGSLSLALLAGCSETVPSPGSNENGDATPEPTPTEEPTPEPTPTEEPTPEPTPTEEEPVYQQDQENELVPPLDVFPEGWIRDDESNPDFDAVFLSEDETNAVLINNAVGETVQEVREAFEETKSLYRDPQDMELADQAFWDTRDSQAVTVFRHSNAIADVRGVREAGLEIEPAVDLSQSIAFDMFEHWESL